MSISNKFDKSVTKDEQRRITEVGIEFFEGRCSCGIYKDRPKMCQDGPLPHSRMVNCDYHFDDFGNRYGRCSQCGRCCALPRKQGSPYGMYDPNGSRCKYLEVK